MVRLPLDEMNPKQWIHYKRSEYGLGDSVPFKLNKQWLEGLLAKLPESERQKARVVWEERDGQPIYDIYDDMMNYYVSQIAPIVLKEDQDIFENVNFGILPTCDFNGYAGFTRKGDRVIILHEALGYTLNYWSHWYLRMLEEGDKFLIENPQRQDEILRHIVEIWNGYPLSDLMPDVHPISMDAWELSETMTACAISFVLGHELGHVIKNHPPYGPNANENHAMEYEADAIGLRFAIRYAIFGPGSQKDDTYFTKVCLIAPLFALCVMSLFGDRITLSHPSPSSRISNALNQYKELFKELFHDEAETVWNGIDSDLQSVLETSSTRLFDIFSEYRKTIADLNMKPQNRGYRGFQKASGFRKS